MSWRRSSAINYGADAPSCAWNFDWHDVRVPTTEQQGLARGSKCVAHGKYKWETNYIIFEWYIYFFFTMMLLLHYGKLMWCVSFSVRRTIVVPVCVSKVEKAMRRGCVVPKIQRVCFSDASRQMYVNVLAGLKKWNEASHPLRSVMCHKARASALPSLPPRGPVVTSIIKWQF